MRGGGVGPTKLRLRLPFSSTTIHTDKKDIGKSGMVAISFWSNLGYL